MKQADLLSLAKSFAGLLHLGAGLLQKMTSSTGVDIDDNIALTKTGLNKIRSQIDMYETNRKKIEEAHKNAGIPDGDSEET